MLTNYQSTYQSSIPSLLGQYKLLLQEAGIDEGPLDDPPLARPAKATKQIELIDEILHSAQLLRISNFIIPSYSRKALAYARHVIKRTDTHDVERALAMVKAAKDRLMDAADARSQHDVREATSGGSPTAAEVPCNVQGDFRHGDAIDEVVQGYALEGEDEDTDEEEEEYQLIPRSIQEATAETRFEFNISSWPGAFQQLTPMVISAFLAAAQKRGALWIAGKGGLCVTEHGALQASTSQETQGMGPWASRLLVEVPGYIVSQLQSRFPPNFFKYRMLQIALRGLPGMQAHAHHTDSIKHDGTRRVIAHKPLLITPEGTPHGLEMKINRELASLCGLRGEANVAPAKQTTVFSTMGCALIVDQSELTKHSGATHAAFYSGRPMASILSDVHHVQHAPETRLARASPCPNIAELPSDAELDGQPLAIALRDFQYKGVEPPPGIEHDSIEAATAGGQAGANQRGQMTVSIRRADRPHDKTTTVSLSTIEGREQYANLAKGMPTVSDSREGGLNSAGKNLTKVGRKRGLETQARERGGDWKELREGAEVVATRSRPSTVALLKNTEHVSFARQWVSGRMANGKNVHVIGLRRDMLAKFPPAAELDQFGQKQWEAIAKTAKRHAEKQDPQLEKSKATHKPKESEKVRLEKAEEGRIQRRENALKWVRVNM